MPVSPVTTWLTTAAPHQDQLHEVPVLAQVGVQCGLRLLGGEPVGAVLLEPAFRLGGAQAARRVDIES